MRIGEIFRYDLIRGDPLAVGDVEIVPHARVATLRTPYGGWVWNRPVALTVRREGKEDEVIPIFDATLVSRLLLGAFSIFFGGLALSLARTKRRS